MYGGEQDKFEEFKEKVLLKLKGNAQLFPSEAVKLVYIASRLEEHVHNDVKKRIWEDFFGTSEEFLAYLQKAVGDPNPARTSKANLTELKQRSTPRSRHLANFSRLSEETLWDEAAKLHILQRSLLEELKDELLHLNVPRSLDACLEKIVEVDIQLQQWKKERGARKNPAPPPLPTTRSGSGPSGSAASHP